MRGASTPTGSGPAALLSYVQGWRSECQVAFGIDVECPVLRQLVLDACFKGCPLRTHCLAASILHAMFRADTAYGSNSRRAAPSACATRRYHSIISVFALQATEGVCGATGV
eukprot:3798116-Rhodomonas_salina.3